jgi:addiction module HigA family antidote
MAAKRFPDRQPTHPDAILHEDVLPEPRVPAAEFATRLGVPRQMLHGILREQLAVTLLGRLLGNGTGLWLRMQQAHDRWRVECDKANAS